MLVGNRMADTRRMPFIRKCTNQFMRWLLSRAMGRTVPDTQCGFRLYAKEVLPFIRTESACRTVTAAARPLPPQPRTTSPSVLSPLTTAHPPPTIRASF